ncbi:MAG: M23 family metallopeptidase [candidate division Zixibacteria bacterium]|nr:M23 family metallopeptidase [candidate division Zixibacteria bacterium]
MFTGSIFQENYSIVEKMEEPIEPESENIEISAIYSGKLHKNSSLYTELLHQDVPKAAVAKITTRFSELFDLTNSHPGDEFKLFLLPGDSILAFEYITNDLKKYRLESAGSGYIDRVTEVELEKRIEYAEAVIETSLWAALNEVLPDHELFTRITDIYAWEIDFLTESRVGDTFKLVFQAFYKDGEFIKCGDVLAAEYILSGTPHRAFLYTDPDGYTDYYDENGYSLRRALLKSPLNYRRISSGYSHSRLHPIYKIYRPHLGIDYAAKKGTPVVAAGDGIVKVKGWVNGFGNYVEIQHEYGLSTGYGHLNGFAKGVVEGRRVRQGQVIGYVGETGVATGPHLDYRVKKDGNYANPLRMTVPASSPVKADYLPNFRDMTGELAKDLDKPVERKLYVLN